MGVTVPLRVTPRAAQEAISGWRGGRLQVHTTAPPLDDRANDAVRRLLAAALRVPKSQVLLTHGRRGREKLAAVYGLSAEDVRRRLGGDAGS